MRSEAFHVTCHPVRTKYRRTCDEFRLLCRKCLRTGYLWPSLPIWRESSLLQLSVPSPGGAALADLYHSVSPKIDLLPPYRMDDIDLMEAKGHFRFPTILRYYLENVSREAIGLFHSEEFGVGDTLKRKPFFITGRTSIKKLFGSKYRVIGISEHDVVVVSGDRHGQVASTCEQFSGTVENIANYLFRVWSDERLGSLRVGNC